MECALSKGPQVRGSLPQVAQRGQQQQEGGEQQGLEQQGDPQNHQATGTGLVGGIEGSGCDTATLMALYSWEMMPTLLGCYSERVWEREWQ